MRKMIIFANKKGRIMNRQPQLMDVSRMRDILTPHLSQIREHVFMNSELTMIRGDHTVFSLLMRQRPPFTINDHRLGIIMNGEAEININLQDRHLKSGTLVYIGPGTIIYPKRLSPDLRIFGMGLFSNFPCLLRRDRCRRHSTVRCATFSYSSVKRISLLHDIFWTPSGKRFMLPTTITVPPSQPSWQPRCTTTTSCSIGSLINWQAAVHASSLFSTASYNWSPSIVPNITRLATMPTVCASPSAT